MSQDPHPNWENIFLDRRIIDTPLGPMLAISNKIGLCSLRFAPHHSEREKESEVTREAYCLDIVEEELHAYFQGTLTAFKTKVHLLGTPFQNLVWAALQQIPYGETRSYSHQASVIGKPKAYRAAANANGANTVMILVPCHRVINKNGALGGYTGGGIAYKEWLLEHERKNRKH